MRRVVIATHGHCFDGLASAALFTALYRKLHADEDVRPAYRACDYGPGDSAVPEAWLDGADNAILDFRYTASSKLTWYFDHHATAFRSAADRARFDAGEPAHRFYDPACTSCSKLIDTVAREKLGISLGHDELVRWADRVDAARFDSPDEATLRGDPEMQLVTVVEHHADDAFLTDLVPRLLERPLADVAKSPDVQARYAPLAEKRRATVERMKAHAATAGDVAFCDIADAVLDAIEKFAMYALFPNSRYAVVVSRSASKAKVSVGFNPWSGLPRLHDIGAICQKHGGGGHPVVGAVTLAAGDVARARVVAKEIVEELNR